MTDLNYENLLDLVKNDKVSEVESLLNTSNAQILTALGPDKYDDLLNEALLAKNSPMVKAFFKHSDLIVETPEGMRERLMDVYSWEHADDADLMSQKDRKNVHQILDYIDRWEKTTVRSNLQTYKSTELQHELEKAKENGFDDLADRIQRRFDFEKDQHDERNEKLPEGTTLNRWMYEKSWILDGQGRLEYDMFGQDNSEKIEKALKELGIEAYTSSHIQKNGTDTDYRVFVDAKDVQKLKQFFAKTQEDLEAIVAPMDEDEILPPEVEDKVITPEVVDPVESIKKSIENKPKKEEEPIDIEATITPINPEKDEDKEKTTIPPVDPKKEEDKEKTSVPPIEPEKTEGEKMTTEIRTPADDKVIAFAKKLHEIAKVSGLPSDQEEMPIQRYVAQNEDDYRLFMDAMKNMPAITDENQDFTKLPQTAQVMQGVELLAWYAGGFRHPKKDESVQMLHDLADKGYPQAQVHYVNYLMAHLVTEKMVDEHKDEIRYYYDQLQANKSLPEELKNSREYMRVFKFMHEVKDIDTDPMATRPELIKWEEAGKVETRVPPKKETEKTPVPPKKEDKTTETIETEPYAFRSLENLLRHHDASAVQQRLATVKAETPEHQALLQQIKDAYAEKAKDANYQIHLNQLVKTKEDADFVNNSIDTAIDDGEVNDQYIQIPKTNVKSDDTPDKKKDSVKESTDDDVISGAEQPVADDSEKNKKSTDEAKTSVNPNNQELTLERSPLIEDKKGEHNWHFDDNGQICYNMEGLSDSAREQVILILASHGIECAEPEAGTDSLYLKNPQDFKALKKAWARARQYKEYNPDLLIEPKGPLVEWNSPGFEKYWCRHHTKNMWFDNHPDVSSFNIKLKPYYLNVDGFDDFVVKATEQYLRDKGINFDYTEASEDLKSKKNPIAKGQRVIVVKNREDIKKLQNLWLATKRAPELANPPKGMLPNGMPANEQDIVSPMADKNAPSEGKNPKNPTGKGLIGGGLGLIGDGLGLVGKQVENVGDSFLSTLGKFTDSTLGKSFASPEEFGEEFLYQMMAFPMEWLKAYFDTIAKDDPKKKAELDKLLNQIDKAQKEAGLQSPFAGKTPEYTPEMHKQRAQAMRDFFNRPENADKKEMLKQMAQAFGQHPEFKQAYDKMFPNAPFGFEEAMNTLSGQDQAQTKVQPTLTGGKQPTISPEMAALMERVAQLEQKQSAAEEKLNQTLQKLADKELELAQEKAKNKQQEEKIAALQQKLAALEQGKSQPVEAPKNQYEAEKKAFMDAQTAEEKQAHLNNIAPNPVPNVEAYQAQMQAEAKAKAQPAPNPEQPTQPENNSGAQPPVPPTEKTQTSASETVVIRDLNTLDKQDPSKGAEVVAKLEEAKNNTNDVYTASLMDIVQKWYETPADKREGDLNELIRTQKDVEAAKLINNAINDGYNENTGIYKKTIELKDSVDKEKVLSARESALKEARAELAKNRPDLYEQIRLSHDEKGEAVLSIGDLKIQENKENNTIQFSTESGNELTEVLNRYNLSNTDKKDLRIIMTYFDEKTKQIKGQKMSMAQVKKGQSR